MRIALRVQSNIRDIVPNNGFLLSASSRTDVWAKAGTGKNRWVNIQGDLYLPYLRLWNVGLRMTGGLHVQNRGGILDLDPFLPRGYENELVFLGRGAFLRYGMEYTQPLWYIDNGLILLPLYFKALYIFGFAEQLVSLDDQAETGRFSSMGSGLGLQFRFAHALDLDFKLGLSYLLDEHRWKIFFR